MKHYDRSLLRLCDANLNRTTEGLRVLEECARMLLNNASLTEDAKSIRHDLAAIFRNNPALDQSLPLARDTRADVLKSGATESENTRADLSSLVRANARRAAEAVRVLEEYGKFISDSAAVSFKDIRFRIYDLEQQLSAVLHHDKRLTPDRLRFGLVFNLEWLQVTVKDAVEAALRHGCGLFVLDGGGLTDRLFADSVHEVVESVNGDVTVLVTARTDIALDSGADGVLVDAEGLRPSQSRVIGGHGMVIAYRMPENVDTDIPDSINMVICTANTVQQSFRTNVCTKPVVVYSTISDIPPDIVADGFLFPFPDVGSDELVDILANYDTISCRAQKNK